MAGECSDGAVRSYGPVIGAILSYDDAALTAALDGGADPSAADDSGIPALHYCVAQGWPEGLAILLAKGADALQKSRDAKFRVGFTTVYMTGGTAAHKCAESCEPEMLRTLAEARPECLQQVDEDGHTPADVAQLLGSASVLAALGVEPLEATIREKRRVEWLGSQRKRIEAVTRDQVTDKLRSIQDRYVPHRLHPTLFTTDRDDSVGMLERSFVENPDPVRVAENVLSVPVLPEAVCQRLLEEARHFNSVMADDAVRPNSMNRYGTVLSGVGCEPLLWHWVHAVLTPLSHKWFPEGSSARGPFESMHAFIIQYEVGRDEHLAQHVDDSDLTLNICLGTPGFEGADLYFKTEGGEVVHKHTVGHGVVHPGGIMHGVRRLTAGSRSNLVLWCRHRRPQHSLQGE